MGYNFKITDMQAALGVAQTHRLEGFAARRRENFERLHAALQPLEEHVVLPRALPEAEPNWFGYPLTLREGGAAERRRLQLHLLRHNGRFAPAPGRQHDAAAGV